MSSVSPLAAVVTRRAEIAWAALLGLAVFVFACFGIDENDIWWHLAAGRFLWQTGHLPSPDPFSFLLAGHPWVNESWLFQLLLFGVWQIGGAPALTLFKALWITALVVGLGLAMHRRGLPWPLFGLLALVPVLALAERIVERPELATWACLVAFLLLLPRGTEPPTGRTLWLLPLIQVVWTNSHPAFLLGPVVVGLTAAGQAINVCWRREPAAQLRSLVRGHAVLLALVTGATFVNPYGWQLHLVPFRLVGTSVFVSRILEWQRPWLAVMFTSRWALPALLALAGPPLALTWRRREAVPFALLAAFAVLGLQSVRHGALFAWVALAVASESWAAWWRERPGPRAVPWPLAVASAGLLVVFTLASLTGWSWWVLGSYRRFGLHPESWRYPEAECQFVLAHDLHGEMFNDYNIGGYLMWRLYPSHQVCTDGRAMPYGGDLIEQTLDITEGREDWRPFFAAHGIHWALVANEAENLIRALWSAPDWHLVFAGPRALLFADDSPGQRDLIGQFAIEGDDLDALTGIEPTPSAPWWEAPATPYPEVRRSELLFILGRPDLASRVLERALVRHPRDARLLSRRALFLLHAGRVLMHRRAWSEAETALRTLVDFDPTSRDGWNNLGVLLARTGRPDAAREAWQRALALDPGNRAIQTNLQRLEARAGAASPEP